MTNKDKLIQDNIKLFLLYQTLEDSYPIYILIT